MAFVQQHFPKEVKFEDQWHEFFVFLEQNIQHVKVVQKLNIQRLTRTKERLTKKKTSEEAQLWYSTRIKTFKKQVEILESSPYLFKIEEEAYTHTFTLTPKYQLKLQSLVKPQHFWTEHPFFEMFELNPTQLEFLSQTNPLFEGIYNLDTSLNAVKEVHIDVNYEELFPFPQQNIWLLTQTWSIFDKIQNNVMNSGTEFIKIPCLKPKFMLSDKFDFNIDIQIHKHSEGSLATTLCGQVFSCLTSFYCEKYTSPDQWQHMQPGVLHNAARCYFHRSPLLMGVHEPFERKHWVFDTPNLINDLIEELRLNKKSPKNQTIMKNGLD
jgi:hypothetical protein